jgi:hypothetical protein
MSLEDEWRDGLQRVVRAYDGLCQVEGGKVRTLCLLMMERKEAMYALTKEVDASIHCAACGGACCVRGKYHFTPVDLLAYLVTGKELFSPLFDNGLCPYLDQTSCLMPPAYRPFNCITFNCEIIEDHLQPHEVGRFYQLERELRLDYVAIRAVFPAGFIDGALLKGTP